MTTRMRKRPSKYSRSIPTKTIDMVALGAALSWVAAMVGFSLRGGETSILVWLMRGMWGAIFVYATFFLILHAVVSKARSLDGEDSPKGEKKEIERDPLTDLQAADSGELARIVSENVTE